MSICGLQREGERERRGRVLTNLGTLPCSLPHSEKWLGLGWGEHGGAVGQEGEETGIGM